MGNDPVLWTWLDFSYRNENTHVTMVKTVSLRFHFMSSMTLKNFRSPDEMERMLLHMGNNCARLREVHLFNCALRSETLVRLGEMCPNITSLSLICCDENYRKNHYMWSYMRDCSFGGIQVKFGGFRIRFELDLNSNRTQFSSVKIEFICTKWKKYQTYNTIQSQFEHKFQLKLNL